MRLDALLVARGLARSRARAQALIEAGHVQVPHFSGKLKSSTDFPDDTQILLQQEDFPYVSRGALKLLALIEQTNLRVEDEVVLDVGASTGGFTQVCLQYRAQRVYAVDVGTAQLATEVLFDNRVVDMSQTDARTLEAKSFDLPPTVLVMDVSFISATKILPHVLNTFQTIGQVGLLVKPQFELSPQEIGSGGIVRDEKLRQKALANVVAELEALGFDIQNTLPSPIEGGDGNQEFILYATRKE